MLTLALLLTGCVRVLSLLLALALLASTPCLATSGALGDVVSALTGAPTPPLVHFSLCQRRQLSWLVFSAALQVAFSS